MEELKEEIKQIEDLWKKVYDVCVATPSLYTPHLPNLTVDEVGGVVLTVLQWMKALDTNRKGKNTYVLSKSVMITSLNATITRLKNIASGNYNYFPQFVTNLNQLLIALFPVTFLNSKDKSYANLSMDFAEELAKLKNLSEKIQTQIENYNEAIQLKNDSKTVKKSIDEINVEIVQIQEGVQKDKESIEKAKKDIETEISNISSSLKQIKDFSGKIPNIQTSNEEAQNALNQLIEKATEVNKTLEELLPGSTSAGLASSFYNKVQQLKWSKRCLLLGFIVSILALSYLTMPMLDTPINQDTSIWKEFFHRLPLLFPPIWLGWFFARSYGHANRLQEKYAYKEAMSRAFQGYRKQMEEVNTDSELAKSLSELTLTVLAENPSDIFERNCWDETPFHSLIGMIIKRFKFGNKNNNEK